jgi:hypothetical protein
MTENRPSVSVYPDIITVERAHGIINNFVAFVESTDFSQVPVQCRVRSNREYVIIPKNTIDVSGDIGIIKNNLDKAYGALGMHEQPLDADFNGIYYCNVDEFRRLEMERVFIRSQDTKYQYGINLVKSDSTVMINISCNTKRMWGAYPGSFRYQRGDYRDIIISIPLNQYIV